VQLAGHNKIPKLGGNRGAATRTRLKGADRNSKDWLSMESRGGSYPYVLVVGYRVYDEYGTYNLKLQYIFNNNHTYMLFLRDSCKLNHMKRMFFYIRLGGLISFIFF
jgi:hypothetical protein